MNHSLSPQEIFIILGGLLSACFLSALVVFYFFVAWGRPIGAFKGFRLLHFSRLTGWLTRSEVWEFFFEIGREFGYRFVLHPALPTLEPDQEPSTVQLSTLELLPPAAYSDGPLTEATLHRYAAFGRRVSPQLVLASAGMLVVCFAVLAIVRYQIFVLLSLLPIPAFDELLTQTITFIVTVMILIGWLAFLGGVKSPFDERRRAWAACRSQLRAAQGLREHGQQLPESAAADMLASIEAFRRAHESGSPETPQLAEERAQALRRLQELAQQATVDVQTLQSITWLVNFESDHRPKEPTLLRQRTRKELAYDIIKDVIIGLVFLVLGSTLHR